MKERLVPAQEKNGISGGKMGRESRNREKRGEGEAEAVEGGAGAETGTRARKENLIMNFGFIMLKLLGYANRRAEKAKGREAAARRTGGGAPSTT